MRVFANLLSLSALYCFKDKNLTVKKYYFAVYGAKVARFRCKTCLFFIRRPCFYVSKNSCLSLLFILVRERMLMLRRFCLN